MSDLRPSRNRKAVNYSSFGDCSDDDFADNTPPPSKKQKSSKTSDKSKRKNPDLESGKDSGTEKVSLSGKKPRPALSEKIYERELKEALQLSLVETGHSQEVAVVHRSSDSDCKTDLFKIRPENTKVQNTSSFNIDIKSTLESSLPRAHQESLVNKNKSKPVSSVPSICTVMDDSIEVLDESDCRRMNKKKCKSTKTVTQKKQISDDESEDEYSSDDESDETDYEEDSGEEVEDSDMDFNEKPQKKKTAVTPRSIAQPPRLKPIKVKKHVTNTGSDEDSDIDFNAKPQKKKTAVTSPKSNAQPPRLKPIKAEKDTTNTSPKTNKKSSASIPVTQHVSIPNMSPASTVSSCSYKSPSESAIRKSNMKSSTITTKVKLANPPTSLTSSWKPPAMASPGSCNSLSTVKSPTTGLRLGLSRHQNIKRLHKGFKIM